VRGPRPWPIWPMRKSVTGSGNSKIIKLEIHRISGSTFTKSTDSGDHSFPLYADKLLSISVYFQFP